MNTKFIATVGFFMSMWLIPPINAIAAMPLSCMGAQQCADYAALNCLTYCCKTGRTGTVTSCPTGWTADSSGTCTRNSVSGSDSKGWYTQNYGTCSTKITEYDCYTATNNQSSYSKYNDGACPMVTACD